MTRKSSLDVTGAVTLVGVSLMLALNQLMVKEVNTGLQPVFFAGVRSVLAVGFVWGWMVVRGRPPVLAMAQVRQGVLMGTIFAAEFLLLFLALDLTTVGRAAVIFYSMPVWLAVMAHFGLPGERITPVKGLGLTLAFLGTATAILSRGSSGEGSLAGDLCALGGAVCWAGTAFIARRPVMAKVGPEMQLLWMVMVSGPLLVAVSPLFGTWVRELEAIHILYLVIQASVVVAGVFITWLWLLSVYPATTVGSFAFLTPVLSLVLGAAVYGESLTPLMIGAAALVALGIILINRKA